MLQKITVARLWISVSLILPGMRLPLLSGRLLLTLPSLPRSRQSLWQRICLWDFPHWTFWYVRRGSTVLSDFMLWQCHQDTDIEVVEMNWPDFGRWDIGLILLRWQNRKRALAFVWFVLVYIGIIRSFYHSPRFRDRFLEKPWSRLVPLFKSVNITCIYKGLRYWRKVSSVEAPCNIFSNSVW